MNAVVARAQKLVLLIFAVEASLLVVFIGVIYLFLRFHVLKPVQQLERRTNKFKETRIQDVDPKDEVKTRDEFGRLFSAIVETENVIVQDRAQLEGYIEKVRVMAYQDELTGVKNLNSYDRKTEGLDAQIKEGSAKFAVVMIDMNSLKNINDTYGHGQGDVALKGTSRVICETFKHSPVHRVGGDEFVAILEGQDFENREALFAEIRKGEVA